MTLAAAVDFLVAERHTNALHVLSLVWKRWTGAEVPTCFILDGPGAWTLHHLLAPHFGTHASFVKVPKGVHVGMHAARSYLPPHAVQRSYALDGDIRAVGERDLVFLCCREACVAPQLADWVVHTLPIADVDGAHAEALLDLASGPLSGLSGLPAALASSAAVVRTRAVANAATSVDSE